MGELKASRTYICCVELIFYSGQNRLVSQFPNLPRQKFLIVSGSTFVVVSPAMQDGGIVFEPPQYSGMTFTRLSPVKYSHCCFSTVYC
jgi:hypothetical protein